MIALMTHMFVAVESLNHEWEIRLGVYMCVYIEAVHETYKCIVLLRVTLPKTRCQKQTVSMPSRFFRSEATNPTPQVLAPTSLRLCHFV